MGFRLGIFRILAGTPSLCWNGTGLACKVKRENSTNLLDAIGTVAGAALGAGTVRSFITCVIATGQPLWHFARLSLE